MNLLDNAIKFSPEGSTVWVTVSSRGGEAILALTDQGPGIPPEHQEKVFDRFYRVDKARARSAGGYGLGLSIARQAVQFLGGRIDLDSVPGRGTTFRIVLPLRA
jgi:signal transduction histidine kinase